jgi:hypothetical protein
MQEQQKLTSQMKFLILNSIHRPYVPFVKTHTHPTAFTPPPLPPFPSHLLYTSMFSPHLYSTATDLERHNFQRPTAHASINAPEGARGSLRNKSPTDWRREAHALRTLVPWDGEESSVVVVVGWLFVCWERGGGAEAISG